MKEVKVNGMIWYDRLAFARKVTGKTLREVASIVGFSNAYLCEIENGRIKDPSVMKIKKLLQLYNLNLKDVFD